MKKCKKNHIKIIIFPRRFENAIQDAILKSVKIKSARVSAQAHKYLKRFPSHCTKYALQLISRCSHITTRRKMMVLGSGVDSLDIPTEQSIYRVINTLQSSVLTFDGLRFRSPFFTSWGEVSVQLECLHFCF